MCDRTPPPTHTAQSTHRFTVVAQCLQENSLALDCSMRLWHAAHILLVKYCVGEAPGEGQGHGATKAHVCVWGGGQTIKPVTKRGTWMWVCDGGLDGWVDALGGWVDGMGWVGGWVGWDGWVDE